MIDTDRKRKKYLYALFKKNGYSRSFVQGTLRSCKANRKKRKEGKSEEKKKKELKDTIVLPHIKGLSEQIKRVSTPLDNRLVNRAESGLGVCCMELRNRSQLKNKLGLSTKFLARTLTTSISARHFVRSRHGWLSINDIRRTNALTNRQWPRMRPSTSMTSTGRI